MRGEGGIHFSINKIQYDNLTSMQGPSHYNHLVYHVLQASLYEQFLKLLNVYKACSDLVKELLYLGNYIYLYFFQISD